MSIILLYTNMALPEQGWRTSAQTAAWVHLILEVPIESLLVMFSLKAFILRPLETKCVIPTGSLGRYLGGNKSRSGLNPILYLPPAPHPKMLHSNPPFPSPPLRLLTLDFHNLSALIQRYGHNIVQAISEIHSLWWWKTKLIGQKLLQVAMIQV